MKKPTKRCGWCATASATDTASPGTLAISAARVTALRVELRDPAVTELGRRAGRIPLQARRDGVGAARVGRHSSRKRDGEEVAVGVVQHADESDVREPIGPSRRVRCDYMRVLVGLISDTHGLVRPEVFDALAGVEVILHAGDVGGRDVLDELRAIAPVYAVYGNVDPPGEPGLSARVAMCLEGVEIHVSHGHELGRPTPDRLLARYDADVIVYGHTHQPLD